MGLRYPGPNQGRDSTALPGMEADMEDEEAQAPKLLRRVFSEDADLDPECCFDFLRYPGGVQARNRYTQLTCAPGSTLEFGR